MSSAIKFSSGTAAVNASQEDCQLCFDWSFDAVYFNLNESGWKTIDLFKPLTGQNLENLNQLRQSSKAMLLIRHVLAHTRTFSQAKKNWDQLTQLVSGY